MREIGGYMEFETYYGKELYDTHIALNTVRSGIRLLLKYRNYTRIYLPVYLCDCIYELLQTLCLEYEFYRIDKDWLPIFNGKLKADECLYVVNYYGQLSNACIMKLKEKYKNIILDNTQAFFQEPVPFVDTLYNCRKYFGVSDGCYLYTDLLLREELKPDISYDRFSYLLGRYEVGAAQFYPDFTAADESLKNKELMGMSKLTHNIMKSIHYGKIAGIRRDNFNYLHDNLYRYNLLNQLRTGTFMYPFMCRNAQALRQILIQEKIYIPLLWPNVLTDAAAGSYDYKLAETILPLPIDHRYGKREMDFIITQIQKYIK